MSGKNSATHPPVNILDRRSLLSGRSISRVWFLVLMGIFFTQTAAQAAIIDKAMGALASGKLTDARRMAQRVLADNPRDARALLLLARTERGGRTAQSWAEQAISAADGRSPGDEAILFLLEAYAATKSYGAIIERAERFFRDFDRENEFADAVRWWTALANIKLGKRSTANTDLQRAVSNQTSSTWSRRLRLLHADSRVDAEQAVGEYKKLLGVKDQYVESQCLLGLAWTYQRLGEIDHMLLYRGILVEKYPRTAFHFMEQKVNESIAEPPPDDEAEKLADVAYTVQLGAFRDKKNAQRLRDKYKRRGYTVHFFDRKVAGKRYWVVQVGSFTSLDKAKKLQDKMQNEDQAVYRVVLR